MATKSLVFGQSYPRHRDIKKILRTDLTVSKEQTPSTAIFTSSLINTSPKLISSISQNKQPNETDLKHLISNRSSLKMITDELAGIAEKKQKRGSRPSIPGLRKDLKKYLCHPQKQSLIESVYIGSKDRQFETSVVSPSRVDSFSSSSDEDRDDRFKLETLPLEKQMKSHFRQKQGIQTGESDLQNITLKSILKASSSILNFTGNFQERSNEKKAILSKRSHFGSRKGVRFGRKILVFKYHPDSSIAEKNTEDSGKREKKRKRTLKQIRESWFRKMKKR